ncbi:MAG: c-type cytochrome [Saprospiraceae bacterium]|nr:c-type cytochrome [Saprospiraceae bacterium]MCB9319915.1 c-type cytochrome [Lewinellaceae bacterium]
MRYGIITGFVLIGLLAIIASSAPETPVVADDAEVAVILGLLGEPSSPNRPDMSVTGASAKRGEELVKYGITTRPDGGRTTKQSRHFVCTSCHNQVREDPDLTIADPQARLDYARTNELDFLQGTTFYGTVNKKSWYNGDYYKKYGDLVEPARKSLREAIHLCAIECSQGRELEPWEMESVLAYFWTLGYRMKDLNLSEKELATIQQALRGEGDNTAARELIHSKYLDFSPATFIAPPDDRKAGAPGIEGDPENGKYIYELSCLHCHEDERYSFFALDNTRMTFRFLEKHLFVYDRYSIYQVVRWGTSPLTGKKAYMPQYTAEKMSVQQLEDLRAYILSQAR